MSRPARVRRVGGNVVNKRIVTFAMIELADPRDCTDRKRMWKRYKFKDITPLFASRSSVPSMRGKIASTKGTKLIELMDKINAHWYVLSGHHGRIFADENTRFATTDDYFNKLEHAGFFNDDYHHGRWTHANRANPDGGKSNPKHAHYYRDELYLSTTPKAAAAIAPFKQKNPLINSAMKAARNKKCKGIIVSACNTLSFKSVRKEWHANYPEAVFFGTFRTIVSGTWVTNAIKRSSMTTLNFWRDPKAVLDVAGNPEKLAEQLARNFPRSRRHFGIGLMYKGNAYVPIYTSSKLRIKKYAHDADI